MKNRNVLARKKRTTKEIWVTLDYALYYGKYVVIHYLDNSTAFGRNYIQCRTLDDVNRTKSILLNNGFKINWDSFNMILEYLD